MRHASEPCQTLLLLEMGARRFQAISLEDQKELVIYIG